MRVKHYGNNDMNEQDENVAEISAKETAELLKSDPSVKLIDVRTPEEHAISHIDGAILVDGSEKVEEVLSWSKDTPIIAHCHHGMRSLDAASYLVRQGFTNVKNMTGGIDAWSVDVDPSVPRY